jgi:FkbM family methyltransferase
VSTAAPIETLFRSQWRQDRFIYENLMQFRNGTYFEVGAHDGETLSNTYFFEHALGWHGALVEMQPHFIPEIRRKRPHATVFGCGLGPARETLLYLEAGDRSGLLRYVEHAGIEHLEIVHRHTEPKPEYRIHWVDVRPLMEVIAEARIGHIDYFSLDVEGAEMAILRSIDFEKVAIDLFTIEDNAARWVAPRAVLEPLGYSWIGALGMDGFFLHERFAARLARDYGPEYVPALCGKLQQR